MGGSSPKELIQIKDSRIRGVEDSSAMLKNSKELNVCGKGEASGFKRRDRGCRENAESGDQIPGKQTLGSLNPGPLGPVLPTNPHVQGVHNKG